MAKKSNSELVSAALYITVGILLVVFRDRMLHWAMTVAGICFLVFGIIDLIKNNMSSGAVSLIIGLAILILGWTLTEIVILVLGILIAVQGLLALLDVLKRKRKSITDLLFPILTIVMGLLVAFGNGVALVIIIGGALMVVDGVLGLLAVLRK